MNVAVAWGCLLAVRGRLRYTFTRRPSDAATTAWWNENKPEGVTDELAGCDIMERFGWSLLMLHGDKGGQMQVYHGAAYKAAGLPMRSLHGQTWYRKEEVIRQSGIITPGSQSWLPYVPIWPGFTVNTLFYAAILWLLIPGPIVLRRVIRVKRGLCVACAYDLRHGEHDACPECGRLPAA